MKNTAQANALLAFPFRPFFLLTGAYGFISIGAWISYLFAGLALPLGWSALHWHSHEMLFGLVPAAIAGFLLTAMCNWTGAAPLRGNRLLALIALWLAGRMAMWAASALPTGVASAVDLLFLPCLALYSLRILLNHGNRRNLILVGILVLLSGANILMHLGFLTRQVIWLQLGELMALNIITLMMVIIGGRIIPLFTANWLRSTQDTAPPIPASRLVDKAALTATALLVPADFIASAPWLTGIIALVAALLHAIRLVGWRSWATYREPLVWVLHLAYGWIIVALALKGAAAFHLVAASVWQHALGVGAIATLILGVMTRVALGHTGRPLALPRFAVLIYVSITCAALIRVASALQLLDYRIGLLTTAVFWSFAFTLFVLLYWPILSRPRADSKPG